MPRVVVTNYGTGHHSVLLVNRSILRGVEKAGMLEADLTHPGGGANLDYNPLEQFKEHVKEHGAPDVVIGQACVCLPLFEWCAENCPETFRVLQRDSTCSREYKALLDFEHARLGLEKRIDDAPIDHEWAEYELAHCITVLSRWVERTFHEHGLGDKTRYVSPQVIEIENWNPLPRPSDGIAFRVLAAGEMSVLKGTHNLLRAWRKLRPAADEELLISGFIHPPDKRPEEHAFMAEELRLAREAGNVRSGQWSYLKDMPRRYAACDVYCLPSIQEGSTMTGTEAPAMARAVVLTENCGSDLLEANDGLMGTMVPAGDEDALAEALNVYRNDLPRTRAAGRTGRRIVEETGGCERYEADFARVLVEEWQRFKGI